MNLSILSSGFTTDIFERLAESLLHFVWQGGVLAAIVLIADRSLRGSSAQLRYAVHVTSLLLMLACVPVTYALLTQQPPGDIGAATGTIDNELVASDAAVTSNSRLPAAADAFPASGPRDIDRAALPQTPPVEQAWDQLQTIARFAAPYTAGAYLLGVAFMLGRLALALLGGHRLCSDARPITEPDLLSTAARLARKIGLKAAPVVAWCGRTSVPLVAGLIKPMILLPVALASSLTPHQLEAILAHELAHLRRFDLLVNLLQRVAEALLFFHPAVWYVSRRISGERENCCDDCVLRAGWGRVEYADALVRMAEICAPLRGIGGVNAAAILAAAGNNPSQFKRRILRLIGAKESLRLRDSRGVALAILGVVLAAVLAIPAFFSAPFLVAQNVKSPTANTPAKSDEKPVTPPARQDKDDKAPPKPQEKSYFRGKEALERIESVKPAWSESQNGIEFGIARIGDKKVFRSGERVPLEMFIRNTAKETVKVQLGADFLANVPEVKNERGEAIEVERVFALGSVALYRETLNPGEAFGFRHLGLGLGPNPAPGKENWHPFWAEPKRGKYTLRHTHKIDVDPVDESKPGKIANFTTGTIEFEVAAPPPRKSPDAADPFAAPVPPANPGFKPRSPDRPPPRDGVHRIFRPDGKQLSEHNYKNGQLHGPWLQFNSNGEVYVRQNYKEGKLDGFSRTYEMGKVVGETFYKDGKPEGATFVRRDEFKMNGQYLNGKRAGTWTTERIGLWKWVRNYKDGLLDGSWEGKSADGKRVFRLTYDMGKLVDKGDELKAFPFLQKLSALVKDGRDPLADRTLAMLEIDVDLQYSQTPATEVVEDMRDRFGTPMYVDIQATDIAGIGEKPISVNEKQIPLFLGLHEIATGHDLTFDYRFHALWLTTPKAAAEWKDTTGVSELKPPEGSPLAKALPEPPEFDLLATPLSRLAEPLQKEHDVSLEASRAKDAEWHQQEQRPLPGVPLLSLQDALSITLYMNKCRCFEKDGKLVIEPLEKKP